MASSSYHQFKIADGQKKKLQTAFATKTPVTLRLKPEHFGCGDEILLTATQINRLRKADQGRKGADLKMSQTRCKRLPNAVVACFLPSRGLAKSLLN